MLSNLSPRVVRASAGSGKTFQLSSRFIQLVLLGEEPDRILATTFTRKAAGEIRDRIFERLVEGAASKDAAKKLGAELGMPSVTQKEILHALKRCVSAQHRLQICTLDSFFIDIARSFSAEIKLPPQWRLFEDNETDALFDQAVQELCEKGDAVLELLRLVQRGEGGRKVHESLVRHISALRSIVLNTDPNIWDLQVEITPPEKAALEEAIDRFRRFPIPLNKSNKPYADFEKAHRKITQIISEGSGWEERVLLSGGKFISSLIEGGATYSKAPLSEELHALFAPIRNQIRCAVLGQIKQKTKALRSLTDQIVGLYEERRIDAAAVSFDDVKRLLFVAAITGNLTEVFFRIDTRIKHVLLDEFQDTSLDEWRLIEPILDEVLSHSDGSHTFFCVGDTKQSIYGFRGGVAEIFDTLESRWTHLESERMEVSRRSSPFVLNFVNRIFQAIGQNDALSTFGRSGEIWQSRFEPHRAYHDKLNGEVSVWHVANDSQTHSAVSLCAQHVSELRAKDSSVSIGVLVREQRAIAPCLYELSKRGIVASGEGGSSLLDSPVVSVLISFLTLIDHPGDTIAHFHVATSPLAKALGVDERDTLAQRDARSREFRTQILKSGLYNALSALIARIEPLCSSRDLKRVSQLLEATVSYTVQKTIRLSSYIEGIKKLKILDPEQSSVRVMTIHKSKGLEFDAVFLCDLDTDIVKNVSSVVSTHRTSALEPPTSVTVSVKSELRVVDRMLQIPYEASREQSAVDALSVLYVALTRARYGLYLYGDMARSKKSFGKIVLGSLGAGDLTDEVVNIFHDGTPDWVYSKLVKEEKKPEIIQVPVSVKFSESQTKGARHLTKITPSYHDATELCSLLSERALTARGRGILFHALLEKIEWIEGIPQNPVLLDVTRSIAKKERLSIEPEIFVKEFITAIKKPKISEVLSQNRYEAWRVTELDAYRERRFSVVIGDKISVGTIDRLIVGRNGDSVVHAEILDFKTDFDILKNLESYRSQLQGYREAISTMYSLPVSSITASIVYLEKGEVIEV